MTTHSNSPESREIRHRHPATKNRNLRRFRAATAAVTMTSVALAGAAATAGATAPSPNSHNAFRQVNLVSDLTTVGAKIIDPAVRNPWGIAMGPTTPLWVDNQFNPNCTTFPDCAAADLLTKVTLYKGANGHDPIQKVGLEVTASSPFGIVFNPTKSFVVKQNMVKAPARFLFNEFGAGQARVTGWSNATSPPPTTTVTKATKAGTIQTGLALVPDESMGRGKAVEPRLLAADFVNGVIDVYNGKFKHLKTPHAFVDKRAAKNGFTPYNVAYLKGRVYVAYGSFEKPGGALTVFTKDGRLIKRLVTGKPLSLPWGMTIAPEHWGRFGGAILVGNVESGQINAFNRRNGHLLGTISDKYGKPLINPGLWGLAFGNGTIGTPKTLLFAAGIGETPIEGVYEHGLIGLIKPVDR
jgi:uncharacterized protein (TIGR03118 family)